MLLLSLVSALLSTASVDLAAGAGVDTNPLAMPSAPARAGAEFGARSGTFFPVEARLRWRTPPRSPIHAGVQGAFDGVLFTWAATPARPADLHRYDGELSLPVSLASRLGVEVTLEPHATFSRSTFTDPRTGRAYVVDAAEDGGPPRPVSLAHRFDTDALGLRGGIDASLGGETVLAIGGGVTRVDSVADYEDAERIDSWDHVAVVGEAYLSVEPRAWLLEGGYAFRRLDYRERFPHAADGTEVLPGDPSWEPLQLTLHDGTLGAGWISDAGRAVVRYRATRRSDSYAGYLDYTQHAIAADLRWRTRSDVELRFEPSFSTRGYDELRVRDDPEEPVTSWRRIAATASAEWDALSPHTRLFVLAQAESQTASNPLYTWTAFRAVSGVRVRIR